MVDRGTANRLDNFNIAWHDNHVNHYLEIILQMPRIYVYRKRRNRLLARALDQVGGLAALAKRLGVSRQAIQKWDAIPPTRLTQIKRIADAKG